MREKDGINIKGKHVLRNPALTLQKPGCRQRKSTSFMEMSSIHPFVAGWEHLCCHRLGLGENLLGRMLDNTARDRQVGAMLEVQVNLARSLATLVDTPETEPVSILSTTEKLRKNLPDNE
jgi:hypothetical protein